MIPQEMVAKYIMNRDAVLERPDSFDALSDFGRSTTSVQALEYGAKYLRDQLFGENLVFLVVPDKSKRKLDLLFNVSSLTLNGQAATKMREGVFEEGQGIIWNSFDTDRVQLIKTDIHNDVDYLEFSRTTNAVYAVPIRSHSGPIGVFCIDSSDAQNFSNHRILTMIHNFVELILIGLLNSEIAKLNGLQMKVEADMIRLDETDSIREEHRQFASLASTWPIGPTILEVLNTGQYEFESLKSFFPNEDILSILFSLRAANLIALRDTSFLLTQNGKQLLNNLNSISL